MTSALILGIDPGSQRTGFALVRRSGRTLCVVDSGTLVLPERVELSRRLATLQGRLDEFLAQARPDAVAVEDIFTARNARSALALGHARGVALAVAGSHGLPVFAYAPAAVKKAVAGHGRATKDQIQRMVQVLLALDRRPGEDEADAMAVAICHALMTGGTQRGPVR